MIGLGSVQTWSNKENASRKPSEGMASPWAHVDTVKANTAQEA